MTCRGCYARVGGVPTSIEASGRDRRRLGNSERLRWRSGRLRVHGAIHAGRRMRRGGVRGASALARTHLRACPAWLPEAPSVRKARSEARLEVQLGARHEKPDGARMDAARWVPFPCASAPFTTENPKHDVGTPDRNRISVNPSVKTRKTDKTGKTAPRDGVSRGDATRAELRPVRLASPQAGRASSEAETSSTSDPMVSGPKSKRSPADSKSSGSGREPPRARARL